MPSATALASINAIRELNALSNGTGPDQRYPQSDPPSTTALASINAICDQLQPQSNPPTAIESTPVDFTYSFSTVNR